MTASSSVSVSSRTAHDAPPEKPTRSTWAHSTSVVEKRLTTRSPRGPGTARIRAYLHRNAAITTPMSATATRLSTMRAGSEPSGIGEKIATMPKTTTEATADSRATHAPRTGRKVA